MRALLLAALAPTLRVGCWSNPSSDGPDLVGDYALWAIDTRDQMALVKKMSKGGIGVVGPTVFVAGWNTDFIMVMQHPGDGIHTANKSITNYFILRLKDDKLFGPFGEADFTEQRKSLGVPSNLVFTLVYKDLE